MCFANSNGNFSAQRVWVSNCTSVAGHSLSLRDSAGDRKAGLCAVVLRTAGFWRPRCFNTVESGKCCRIRGRGGVTLLSSSRTLATGIEPALPQLDQVFRYRLINVRRFGLTECNNRTLFLTVTNAASAALPISPSTGGSRRGLNPRAAGHSTLRRAQNTISYT
jgi:hypothetical protein